MFTPLLEVRFRSRGAFCDGCDWAVLATQSEHLYHLSAPFQRPSHFLPFPSIVKALQGLFDLNKTTKQQIQSIDEDHHVWSSQSF